MGPCRVGAGSDPVYGVGLRAKPVDPAAEGGAVLVERGAWAEQYRIGAGPKGQGLEGRGKTVGGPMSLREKAGPKSLTVATRYCKVPQSRTVRLKRSSRYCKEEPRAGGHLDRSYPGARGLWVPSPALLASALPPEANFILRTLSRADPSANSTHSDLSSHTCAHASSRACAHGMCPGGLSHPVCTRSPSLLFGLCPTVISRLLYTGHDFYHFTHSPGGRSCNKSGWTFEKPEQRPAPCRRQEEAESRVWNPEPAILWAPRCPHTQAWGGAGVYPSTCAHLAKPGPARPAGFHRREPGRWLLFLLPVPRPTAWSFFLEPSPLVWGRGRSPSMSPCSSKPQG